MMTPFEERYFNWLCDKVLSQDHAVRNYRSLMEIMYKTEFVWVILGDRNRVEDGLELRNYFLAESHLLFDQRWHDKPCSLLEVLIAFANRAYFQTDMPVAEWFWKFLTYLKLDAYKYVTDDDIPAIQEILDCFMYRQYWPDGVGGILPIRNMHRDQRNIELWYQLCDYIADKGIF